MPSIEQKLNELLQNSETEFLKFKATNTRNIK